MIVCTLAALAVPDAYAGPANRNAATQSNSPINLDGFGTPLPAIAKSGPDFAAFAGGQLNFKQTVTVPELGPLFNGTSCAGCHSQPAIGGSSLLINEIRVRNDPDSSSVKIFAVDNMLRSGPQLQDTMQIFRSGIPAEPLGCQITASGCQLSACQQEEISRTSFNTDLPTCDPTSANFGNGENCVSGRTALPLFGGGLVEAVADDTLIQLAQSEPPSVQGVVKMVTENFLQAPHAGRFGWKDDHAFLRGFAGDAYLNEMGISNPDNPANTSNCAVGVTQFGITLENSSLEDRPGADGRADIDRFADFMRALAEPPTIPQGSSASRGMALFSQLNCTGCHAPTLRTSPNPASFVPPSTGGTPISSAVNKALAKRTFHPYSDFLLHDMGSLGDGITSGSAGPTMMRTPPLWGIRAKSVFLHDGRATDIPTAISLHDGQGKAAAQAFRALSASQQADLVNFLDSL
ncbi:MAG TPA: di-heme oxidoredictase family protein [Candidatus Binataceae bacterium]|nr:di-heme oxidoredictase family protein [Candidatus Binataceae bacterium]